MYTWNGFSIIGKRRELLEPLLINVEKTINTIMTNKGKSFKGVPV